jgi:hypothetical protein
MRLPRSITGPSCACGARLEAGNRQCRKCRARARWRRRKYRYGDL